MSDHTNRLDETGAAEFDKAFQEFCQAEKERFMEEDVCLHVEKLFHNNYHIAVNGKPLCGHTQTFPKSNPLSTWWLRTSDRETYCQICAEEAWEKGILEKRED